MNWRNFNWSNVIFSNIDQFTYFSLKDGRWTGGEFSWPISLLPVAPLFTSFPFCLSFSIYSCFSFCFSAILNYLSIFISFLFLAVSLSFTSFGFGIGKFLSFSFFSFNFYFNFCCPKFQIKVLSSSSIDLDLYNWLFPWSSRLIVLVCLGLDSFLLDPYFFYLWKSGIFKIVSLFLYSLTESTPIIW